MATIVTAGAQVIMARRTFFGFNPTGKSVYAWGARLIQLVQSSREKYLAFVFSEIMI